MTQRSTVCAMPRCEALFSGVTQRIGHIHRGTTSTHLVLNNYHGYPRGGFSREHPSAW